MTRNVLNNSLRSHKAIDLSSEAHSIKGRFSPSNPFQVFRFELTGRSRLDFSLNSAGSGCTLELISDRNHNTRINRSEVLRRATSKSQRATTLKQAEVEAGTYFLRISATDLKSTTYQLISAAIPSDISPATPDVSAPAKLSGVSSTPPVTNFPTGDALVDQVVQLTNNYRQQNGLQVVTYSSTLSVAAQVHSQNMALQDFFNHTGLDGSTPGQRVNAVGYQYSIITENIAAGFSTAEQVIQAWINSPSHRANLLNPTVKEIGVGYYYLSNDIGNVNYNMYWTQKFASLL
jgi:uncharacterized protein YkwD